MKNTSLLGPTKADWGQPWPALALSWAEHKPIWAQLGRNLRRTCANLGNLVRLYDLYVRNLVLCGNLPPKLGPRQAQRGEHALARSPTKAKKTLKQRYKRTFSACRIFSRVGPSLGPASFKAANLGLSCAMFCYVGPKFSPSWSKLVTLRLNLGPKQPICRSWLQLGAAWRFGGSRWQLRAKLGTTQAQHREHC